MRYAPTLLLTLLVIAAGCRSMDPQDSRQRAGRQPNLLVQEEIRATQYGSLYEVVAALRPNWLRSRGQISVADPTAGAVVVYLNDVRAGGADYLRQVNAREVHSVEYLNETEANARFGMHQQAGGAAIVIRTMRGG